MNLIKLLFTSIICLFLCIEIAAQDKPKIISSRKTESGLELVGINLRNVKEILVKAKEDQDGEKVKYKFKRNRNRNVIILTIPESHADKSDPAFIIIYQLNDGRERMVYKPEFETNHDTDLSDEYSSVDQDELLNDIDMVVRNASDPELFIESSASPKMIFSISLDGDSPNKVSLEKFEEKLIHNIHTLKNGYDIEKIIFHGAYSKNWIGQGNDKVNQIKNSKAYKRENFSYSLNNESKDVKNADLYANNLNLEVLKVAYLMNAIDEINDENIDYEFVVKTFSNGSKFIRRNKEKHNNFWIEIKGTPKNLEPLNGPTLSSFETLDNLLENSRQKLADASCDLSNYEISFDESSLQLKITYSNYDPNYAKEKWPKCLTDVLQLIEDVQNQLGKKDHSIQRIDLTLESFDTKEVLKFPAEIKYNSGDLDYSQYLSYMIDDEPSTIAIGDENINILQQEYLKLVALAKEVQAPKCRINFKTDSGKDDLFTYITVYFK